MENSGEESVKDCLLSRQIGELLGQNLEEMLACGIGQKATIGIVGEKLHLRRIEYRAEIEFAHTLIAGNRKREEIGSIAQFGGDACLVFLPDGGLR